MLVSSDFSITGPDTTLSLESVPSNIADVKSLVFTTNDNFPYPLRSVSEADGHDPGHPGRIWTNLTSSSHEVVPITDLPATIKMETDVVNGTRVWVDNEFVGRFEVFVFGGRNTLFSWSQMALVAPLDEIEGGVDTLVLEAGTGGGGRGYFDDPPGETPSAAGKLKRRFWWMGMAMTAVLFVDVQ
jgi:hexosaminidase